MFALFRGMEIDDIKTNCPFPTNSDKMAGKGYLNLLIRTR